METNNGGTVNPVNGNLTIEELKNENEKLKSIINRILEEVQQLKYVLASRRAEFLFRIIDSKEFNTEFKMKAIAEIEGFLYPKSEEESEEKE